MRPVESKKLHDMEATCREIGRVLGSVIKQQNGKGTGFALMIFDFEGPEFTWLSNADREDMIKVLAEFQARLKDNTADELSRPKGRG